MLDEEFIHREADRLRGKMAGFIESMGLKESQERAAITTFKSLTYDFEKSIIDKLKGE